MSRDALLAEILRLPPAERRALALAVLEHPDNDDAPADPVDPAVDPAIEDAWHAEVQRRRERLQTGQDRAVPWEEVEARVFRRDD